MVQVRKKANKRVLWPYCATASTHFRKMKGIMFKKAFEPLLFDFDEEGTRRNAIHSFFCPQFDAVFLDSSKKIVDVIPQIKPWNPFIVPAKPARYLTETPAGDAKRVRVKIGMQLEWK